MKPAATSAPRKDIKKALKGVVVKKKPRPAIALKAAPKEKEKEDSEATDDQPATKRRKVADS